MIEPSNEIIFIGYSGYAYTAIDVALKANFKPQSYFELTENKLNPFQLTYLGNEQFFDFSELNSLVFPAIGDNRLRVKIHKFIQKYLAFIQNCN